MSRDVYEGFRRANDWLRLTTVQDTRGSLEAARSLGITPVAYATTRSPVETYII